MLFLRPNVYYMYKIPLGIILLCCAVFTACNNADQNSDTASSATIHATSKDTIVTTTQPLLQPGCYQMVFKKDTAWLNLHRTDSVVTGHLKYHWYMKDGNDGHIQGVIRDSLIIADYTFQSEGMTSVREVRFKIDNNALRQAVGEVAIVNNKVVYTHKDSLTYDAVSPFVKVPCTPAF